MNTQLSLTSILLVALISFAVTASSATPTGNTNSRNLRADRQTNIDNQALPWSVCNCQSSQCNGKLWNANANGPTCGERIDWLIKAQNMAGPAACRKVGIVEYPDSCGGCACQDNNYDEDVAEAEEASPPQQQQQQQQQQQPSQGRCGCSTCNQIALQRDAGGFSCEDRIAYMEQSLGELAACRQIGRVEFPGQCGACNPDVCDASTTTTTTPNTNTNTNTETNTNNQQQQQQPQQYTPPSELYCFPPSAQRTRYENVWGKYTVEVKEGDVCGPSDNLFSNSGVSIQNNKSELTLQLAKRNGQWHASEVRVLLPTSDYFDYGRYSFSVKSIQIHDTSTPNNEVISTTLPPSIILGLFTWDATDNYAIKENYNHEVDIELARWDDATAGDAQFLVQPPGHPQQYRFYTGATNGGQQQQPPSSQSQIMRYNQAPHKYAFDWEPTKISWDSDAGGGQSFSYSTQDALSRGQPDYTQCMPAQVEVRLNLWNLHGSSTLPTEMEDSHVIQVVIDDFTYEPSGQTGVSAGGLCTKDCQCQPGFQCVNQQCTRATAATSRSSSAAEKNSVDVVVKKVEDGVEKVENSVENSDIQAKDYNLAPILGSDNQGNEMPQIGLTVSLIAVGVAAVLVGLLAIGCGRDSNSVTNNSARQYCRRDNNLVTNDSPRQYCEKPDHGEQSSDTSLSTDDDSTHSA